MRYIFSCLCLGVFPLVAMAQSYSNAPMLVVTPQTIAAEQTPPATVVAAIAPSAAAPTTPRATATPAPVSSEAAAAPTTAAAASLWPRDTVPIFMTSCTRLKVELVDPCSCIITKVVAQYTHDEFLKMDAAGTLATDAKMQEIRQQCVDSALMDKKRPANRGAE